MGLVTENDTNRRESCKKARQGQERIYRIQIYVCNRMEDVRRVKCNGMESECKMPWDV